VSENSNEVGDDPYHHHHRVIPEILPDANTYEDEGNSAIKKKTIQLIQVNK
jgi:hypothetical protein